MSKILLKRVQGVLETYYNEITWINIHCWKNTSCTSTYSMILQEKKKGPRIRQPITWISHIKPRTNRVQALIQVQTIYSTATQVTLIDIWLLQVQTIICSSKNEMLYTWTKPLYYDFNSICLLSSARRTESKMIGGLQAKSAIADDESSTHVVQPQLLMAARWPKVSRYTQPLLVATILL
jgi:hypothetical protein